MGFPHEEAITIMAGINDFNEITHVIGSKGVIVFITILILSRDTALSMIVRVQ